MKVIPFTIEDDTGLELEYKLAAKYSVCSDCEGEGTHLHPAIREHAYTMEEFRESFDDEEREQYFQRGGMYDVQCETCKGERVVLVPDEEKCSKEVLKLYNDKLDEEAADEAERRSERLMGA